MSQPPESNDDDEMDNEMNDETDDEMDDEMDDDMDDDRSEQNPPARDPTRQMWFLFRHPRLQMYNVRRRPPTPPTPRTPPAEPEEPEEPEDRPVFRLRSIENSPVHRLDVSNIVPSEEAEEQTSDNENSIHPLYVVNAGSTDEEERQSSDGERPTYRHDVDSEESYEDLFNLDRYVEAVRNPPLNYDLSLPIEHSYLGGLDTVRSSQHLFKPDSMIHLKTIYLKGVFLLPGQEIPLTFYHPNSNFIKDIINSEMPIFGIHIGLLEFKIGITAEIRSYSFQEHNSVTIKVQGRQRFKVLGSVGDRLRNYECKVQILPEIDLNDFFRPLIQNERFLDPSKRPFLTAHHQSALKFYDNQFLMDQLKSKLMKIFESRIKTDEFSFPVDATAFSYFVLTSMPFPDVIKARLLKICSVNFRLRLELSLLSENFDFECEQCRSLLCRRRSFLVMSKLGTSGTFVNKHGIVHELYTFSSVEHVERVSHYSEDYSWFPNYAWSIINCSNCRSHVGWEFKARKPNIHPKKFWALTKNSIRLSYQFKNDTESLAFNMFFEVNMHGNLDDDMSDIWDDFSP